MASPLDILYGAGLTSPALVQQAQRAKDEQDVLRAISAMRAAGLSDQQIQGLAQSQSGSYNLAGGYGLLAPANQLAGINASYKLGRAGLAQQANDSAWGRTVDAASLAGHPQNIVSYLDLLARSNTGIPLNNPVVQNVQPMFPTPTGPYDSQINDYLTGDPEAFAGGGMMDNSYMMRGGPKVLMDASTGMIDATLNENGGESIHDMPGGGMMVMPGKDKRLGKFRQKKIMRQAMRQQPMTQSMVPAAASGAWWDFKPSWSLQENNAKLAEGKKAWEDYYATTPSGQATDYNTQMATLGQALRGFPQLGSYLKYGRNYYRRPGQYVENRRRVGTIDGTGREMVATPSAVPDAVVQPPASEPMYRSPSQPLPPVTTPTLPTPTVVAGDYSAQPSTPPAYTNVGDLYGIKGLAAGGGLKFSAASKAAINGPTAYKGGGGGGSGGGNSPDPYGWQAAYDAYHPAEAAQQTAGGDYRYGSSQGTAGRVPIGSPTYIRDANGNLTAVANPDATAANTYNYVETSYHPATGRVEPHTVTVQMTPDMQRQLGEEMRSKDIAYRIGNMRGGAAGDNRSFMEKVNIYGGNMKNWPKGDVQTGASLWASGQDPAAGHYGGYNPSVSGSTNTGSVWYPGSGRNDANASVSVAKAMTLGGSAPKTTLGQRLGGSSSTPANEPVTPVSKPNNAQQAAAKLLAAIRNNTLIPPEFIAALEKGEVPGLSSISKRAFNSLPKTQQNALIGLWISTGQATDEQEIRDQMDKNTPGG